MDLRPKGPIAAPTALLRYKTHAGTAYFDLRFSEYFSCDHVCVLVFVLGGRRLGSSAPAIGAGLFILIFSQGSWLVAPLGIASAMGLWFDFGAWLWSLRFGSNRLVCVPAL